MPKNQGIVGTVCLYGSIQCGFGYLSHAGDLTSKSRLHGDGEPKRSLSATCAFWHGIMDLQELDGIRSGLVRVYAPCGRLMADVDISKGLPYFGQLKWVPATVFVISAEDIEKAGQTV